MRKLMAGVVAAFLLTLTVAASATEVGQYRDTFESGTWSGSQGSVTWSTTWARQGSVSFVSDASNCESGTCVKMNALTTLLGTSRATRGADTSIFDGDLNLRYSLTAASGLGGSLSVRVRVGGGSWETVKTYSLGSSFTDQPTIALDDDLRSQGFELRFEYSTVLLGGPVYIDDVEIQGVIAEETTTTSTTTTTTSTTTTTTTITTTPATTTTTAPTTTTTAASTTSTEPRPGTSPPAAGSGPGTTTTSTTSPTSTTATTTPGTASTTSSTTPGPTTTVAVPAGPGSGGDGSDDGGGGIRAAARGLQANFQSDLFGEVRTLSSLNGVDFQADYSMAVEVIKASWGWMVLLGLVVAYAIISGLDRRSDRSSRVGSNQALIADRDASSLPGT